MPQRLRVSRSGTPGYRGALTGPGAMVLVLGPLLPFPSAAWELSPQQYPAPAPVLAQPWEAPALNWAKNRPPATATGLVLFVPGALPAPSWPTALLPQHQARNSVVTAQVCSYPASTCRNWCPPTTFVGLVRRMDPMIAARARFTGRSAGEDSHHQGIADRRNDAVRQVRGSLRGLRGAGPGLVRANAGYGRTILLMNASP